MASERDLELLDDYISNRLAEADRVYIEERLRQDPDLRSEYAIQQQIAAGIRKARAAELKKMLANIPTPSLSGKLSYSKAAGAGIVVLLSLSLVYFLSNRPEEGTTPTGIEEPAKTMQSESTENAVADLPAKELEESVDPQNAADEKPSSSTTKPERTERKDAVEKIDVFDPTDENDLQDDSEIPAATESIGKENLVSTLEVDIASGVEARKYRFHYQIIDNKLTLYGPFEKNLYEILEFFTNDKRTVFLYYKSNYYLLESRSGKINTLVPVNDPALLKKLKEFRG